MTLEEALLLEDRVVKFNGRVYPKFGWACILAGGAGSGKGYNFERYIPIQGYKFDIDDLKTFVDAKLTKWHDDDVDVDYISFIGRENTRIKKDYGDAVESERPVGGGNKEYVINLDKAKIGMPLNTTNPKYTSLLHSIASPMAADLRRFFLSNRGATEGKLPNIIFDCTLSETANYSTYIPPLKMLGYNVAIVYIFTDIDTAIQQNQERGSKIYTDDDGNITGYGRMVGRDILLGGHEGVMDAYKKVTGSQKDLIEDVDDIWVIITKHDPNDPDAEIPPDVFNLRDIDNITPGMSDQEIARKKDYRAELDNFIDKNSARISYLNNKEKKHEAFSKAIYTGASELYEALKAFNKLDE